MVGDEVGGVEESLYLSIFSLYLLEQNFKKDKHLKTHIGIFLLLRAIHFIITFING